VLRGAFLSKLQRCMYYALLCCFTTLTYLVSIDVQDTTQRWFALKHPSPFRQAYFLRVITTDCTVYKRPTHVSTASRIFRLLSDGIVQSLLPGPQNLAESFLSYIGCRMNIIVSSSFPTVYHVACPSAHNSLQYYLLISSIPSICLCTRCNRISSRVSHSLLMEEFPSLNMRFI
jgi:hypothetical protein